MAYKYAVGRIANNRRIKYKGGQVDTIDIGVVEGSLCLRINRKVEVRDAEGGFIPSSRFATMHLDREETKLLVDKLCDALYKPQKHHEMSLTGGNLTCKIGKE